MPDSLNQFEPAYLLENSLSCAMTPDLEAKVVVIRGERMVPYLDALRAERREFKDEVAKLTRDLESEVREREVCEDIIDKMHVAVLGKDAPEWSSRYGFFDAIAAMKEKVDDHDPYLLKMELSLARDEIESLRAALSVFEKFGGDGELWGTLVMQRNELLAALKGVVAVADRKTVEFDAARAAIANARF